MQHAHTHTHTFADYRDCSSHHRMKHMKASQSDPHIHNRYSCRCVYKSNQSHGIWMPCFVTCDNNRLCGTHTGSGEEPWTRLGSKSLGQHTVTAFPTSSQKITSFKSFTLHHSQHIMTYRPHCKSLASQITQHADEQA